MKPPSLNQLHYCAFLLFLVAANVSMKSFADGYETLKEKLNTCSAIKNEHSRIQCYDNLSKSVQIDDTTSSAHANEKTEKTMSQQHIKDFGVARIEPTSNDVDTLIDQAIEIHEYAPNRKLIKLSSGQVWRQMLAQRFNIAEKETVRIYKKGSRDSFILSVEGKNTSIQVERVQ